MADPTKPARYVPGPKFASTLAYGLEVLAALRSEGEGISNAELAERLGLRRPTVSRLCATLLQLGYIRKDRQGLYRPAARTLIVGHPMLVSFKLRQLAWAPMRDVALQHRVTVSLVVLSGTQAINISAVRIYDDAPELPELGAFAPLELSAPGCAAYAMHGIAMRQAMQRAILRERRESWKAHEAIVAESVRECRSRGFCLSLGRRDPDLFVAGSPLGLTEEGSYVSVGLNLVASATTPRALEKEWGPRVRSLAQAIRALDPTLTLEFGPDE